MATPSPVVPELASSGKNQLAAKEVSTTKALNIFAARGSKRGSCR
jgi:hypothetical protein